MESQTLWSLRSSVFSRNKNVFQNPSLEYTDQMLESRFLSEIFKFQTTSFNYTSISLLFFLVGLYVYGKIQTLFIIAIVLSLLPFAIFKRLSWLPKRLLLEFSCVIFEWENIGNGSISEGLGCFFFSFFLSFLLVKRWTLAMSFGILEGAVLWYKIGISIGIVVPILTYTFASSVLEKDTRDLWLLYYTYKKLHGAFHYFFMSSPNATFILNSAGKIIVYNKQAMNLLKKINKPETLLEEGLFSDIFSDWYKDSIDLLISNAIKGIRGQDEFLFLGNEQVIGIEYKEDLGCMVESDNVIWNSENCVRMTCIDISSQVMIRSLVNNLYRNLCLPVDSLNKELAHEFEHKKSVNKETLLMFNYIQKCLIDNLLFQTLFTSTLILNKDNFDINSEIHNIVELCHARASKKNITISYTKDLGIPPAVTGDQAINFHILQTMLCLFIDKAIESSEISLIVEVSSAVSKEVSVSYTFNYKSQKFKQSDYELIFKDRDSPERRKTLDEILYLSKTYGVGIAVLDSVLRLLKGYVSNFCIHNYKEFRQSLTIRIPYIINLKKPKNKMLQLSTPPIYETPLTAKWKPDKEKKPIDESQKLEAQIKAIKGSRRSSKSDNRTIEKCLNLSVKPIYSSTTVKYLTSETDEDSDVSNKMKSYAEGSPFLTGTSHISTNYSAATNSINHELSPVSANKESIKIRGSPDFKRCESILQETPKIKIWRDTFKILIVDDDSTLRSIFDAILKGIYDTSTDFAWDGLEGVQQYKKSTENHKSYQIIFMDVYMPGMDGYKATQRIREIEREINAKKVFICGISGDKDLKDRCKEAGMDEFLVKPPSAKEVRNIVEHVQKWFLSRGDTQAENY
ncbi:unnamed protein product [Blepharisma stoltei]|uniref:Response regulatory domain-containing protein n=1 Tax=Blepharisma stoltei TaxID=1481888 RepID=A0AAU9IY03_9CILI|nr:unnamed protein product [Blepharisma stoltei]